MQRTNHNTTRHKAGFKPLPHSRSSVLHPLLPLPSNHLHMIVSAITLTARIHPLSQGPC